MSDKKTESGIGQKFKNLFDTQRVGKGVKREDLDLPFTFVNFFKYYFAHFNDIFRINLLLVFGNFPLFFGLFALTGYLNRNVSTAASYLFPQLYGARLISGGESLAFAALWNVHGIQSTASFWTSLTYLFFGLTALVIFTFGLVNIGATYLMRNRLRRQPIFFWSDFFYAVKKNWKSGLLMGIVDAVLTGLFIYNILFSFMNAGTFISTLVFWGNIILLLIYFFMRFYIYIFLITFDLSFFKCIKNALIFAFLGIGRNFLAFLGIAAVLVLNYLIFGFLMPLGVMLPFVITVGTCFYMSVYAAWPKVKELMIDPYYPDYDKDKDSEEE